MDKNTFLAVVLSGAIMVIWYAVFPPPEPPPREFADNIEQIDKAQSKEFKKEDSTLSATSTLTSIAEVDSSLPSKEVILENNNYRLAFKGYSQFDGWYIRQL